MKKKPGVILYFELRPMVKLLSDPEKGKLFEAILDYGEEGVLPELTGTLKIVWPLVQSQLDADNDRYTQMALKRKYAAYVRWSKEHHELPVAYPFWLQKKGYTINDDPYDFTLASENGT